MGTQYIYWIPIVRGIKMDGHDHHKESTVLSNTLSNF